MYEIPLNESCEKKISTLKCGIENNVLNIDKEKTISLPIERGITHARRRKQEKCKILLILRILN